MITLEMAVHDALHRIRTAYDNNEGKLYLGFSGGKDSTIVAELVKMAELPSSIPFVFADTGIELDAIKRFVDEYDYDNVVVTKVRKPFVKILKEDGYPVLSKVKSEALGTIQKYDDPLETARGRQAVTGVRERGGEFVGGPNAYKIANKHMHFIHPDREYKVANKCCHYMKKLPFKDYAEQNDITGYLSGIRVAEGGARSMQYKSCTVQSGKYKHTMPIIDWSDELCDEFIREYNVKLSDAYTVYGCTRTGCISCPFSRNLADDLKVLWEYEPLKYKASINMLKLVLIDQGIELPFDDEYMKSYNERRPIIEERRLEMLRKYRPEAKELQKKKTKSEQMTLNLEE